MNLLSPTELTARLKKVRLLLTDVDGVMTDGNVYVSDQGETKQFSIQDGLGLVILRRHGVKVGWISARRSAPTTKRGAELKLDYVIQVTSSKSAAAAELLASAGLNWSEVCYVGDDVVDLCLLKHAGVAVAVDNAIDEVKAVAHYITTKRGGHGAVREVVTMILKAQGKWEEVIRHYTE